ncbi:MAG: hypothetical protein ABS939_10820 [Psychrobacillus sp.]
MSKAKVTNAVFFKDSKKPKCPSCLYSLKATSIIDYGVEEDKIFFISPCEICDKPSKYFVDKNDYPIKTKIVGRKK